MKGNNVNDIINIVFGICIFVFILIGAIQFAKKNPQEAPVVTIATPVTKNNDKTVTSVTQHSQIAGASSGSNPDKNININIIVNIGMSVITAIFAGLMIAFWVIYPSTKSSATSGLPPYTATVKETFANMIEGLDNSDTTTVTINTSISSRYKYGNSKLMEDLTNNYTMKDFYIMSSFNSFIMDSEQAYGRMNLIMADYLLAQGVRYFDVCVFPDVDTKTVPVIANSTDKNNRDVKNTTNTILFQDAINTLITKAFNRKYSPNSNDPLIIMIRMSPCQDFSQQLIENLATIMEGIPEAHQPSVNYRYNMQNYHILNNDMNSDDNKINKSKMCEIITNSDNNLNNSINKLQNISENLIVTNFAFIPVYAVQGKILFVMDDSCSMALSNERIQKNICGAFTNYALEDGVLTASSFLQTEKVNLSMENDKNVIMNASDILDTITDVKSTRDPYTNYSKLNMLCAYPSFYQSNPSNSDSKTLLNLGCQIIPMRLYTTDPATDNNLAYMIDLFNGAGSAFVLRSDTINIKTSCQPLTKQKYSSQPKTFTSSYPPAKFTIISNQQSADNDPNFISST